MLIYYDLLSEKELASDSFTQSSPFPGLIAIESKRITVTQGDIDIGGNASADADGEDESVDAAEAKSVIDVVEAGMNSTTAAAAGS